MAKIGIMNPTYAPITGEPANAAVVYGPGKTFAHAINAGISYKRSDTELRGDNVVIESDNSITSGEVTMGLDDIQEADQVALLGVVKTGETGAEEYHDVGDSAPYVGFGYITVRQLDSVVSYIGHWFHKVQFAAQDESTKTKGETIEWQTDTIKGKAIGVNVDSSGTPKFRVRKPCATYEAALTWLKTKANISSGT